MLRDFVVLSRIIEGSRQWRKILADFDSGNTKKIDEIGPKETALYTRHSLWTIQRNLWGTPGYVYVML